MNRKRGVSHKTRNRTEAFSPKRSQSDSRVSSAANTAHELDVYGNRITEDERVCLIIERSAMSLPQAVAQVHKVNLANLGVGRRGESSSHDSFLAAVLCQLESIYQ